jgi:Sec-independent protein translocase protein TatA
MKLFNIGIPEALLLVILIFIILGPGRIVSSARRLGTWFRTLSQSPLWQDIVSTSNEIKDLPQKLIKEAELEEELKSLKEFSIGNFIPPEDHGNSAQDAIEATPEDDLLT